MAVVFNHNNIFSWRGFFYVNLWLVLSGALRSTPLSPATYGMIELGLLEFSVWIFSVFLAALCLKITFYKNHYLSQCDKGWKLYSLNLFFMSSIILAIIHVFYEFFIKDIPFHYMHALYIFIIVFVIMCLSIHVVWLPVFLLILYFEKTKARNKNARRKGESTGANTKD